MPPEHVYTHEWQPHDVLMWDNVATQHLAIFDYALPQRRLMHRITLEGELLERLNSVSQLPWRYPSEMEKNMDERRDDAVDMPSLDS